MSVTTITATELRAELSGLLELAGQFAALAGSIEAKAPELERRDWDAAGPTRFANGISGELRGVWEMTHKGDEPLGSSALELVERIEDAIAILGLATEKGTVDAR